MMSLTLHCMTLLSPSFLGKKISALVLLVCVHLPLARLPQIHHAVHFDQEKNTLHMCELKFFPLESCPAWLIFAIVVLNFLCFLFLNLFVIQPTQVELLEHDNVVQASTWILYFHMNWGSQLKSKVVLHLFLYMCWSFEFPLHLYPHIPLVYHTMQYWM